jgi:hypothetical protein
MQHRVRSASSRDCDIVLASHLAELEELMQEFRPAVPHAIEVLNHLQPFAADDERAKSLKDLLAFFIEKRAEPDFSPSLDCRFPFFWGRFVKAWIARRSGTAKKKVRDVTEVFSPNRVESVEVH